MGEQTPTGRRTLAVLAIVAVAIVGLSGCIDASAAGGAGDVRSYDDGAVLEQVTVDGEPADVGGAKTTAADERTSESTEEATVSGASTATESQTTSPEPEGPARGEVVTTGTVRIVSHDIKDRPEQQVSVAGTLENPSDDPVRGLEVTVVLFDAAGDVIDEATTTVGDVPANSPDTYAVTFDGVDYLEVERYRVETTEAAAPATSDAPVTGESSPDSTADDTPSEDDESDDGSTGSTASSGAEKDTSTSTGSVDEGASAGEADVQVPPTECSGFPVDDEQVRIVTCDMKDYPDGKANVGVTVMNVGDRDVERTRVSVVAYDDVRQVVDRHTTQIDDLAPGEQATFTHQFDADYSTVNHRYVVVASAEE